MSRFQRKLDRILKEYEKDWGASDYPTRPYGRNGRTWSGHRATFSVEVHLGEDGMPQDLDTNPLPELRGILRGDGELVIEWESSGYYQPASRWGGPDGVGSPAEGEEDRTLGEAYLLMGPTGTERVELHPKVQQALFARYHNQIQDQDY